MKKKKRGSKDKDVDLEFFEFQRDFYKTLKEFIDKGNTLQATAKKKGALAPTEVLMFLLFWNVIETKFNEAQLDFVYMMFNKIMDEGWMKGRLIDPPEGFEVETVKPKKETLH